MSNASTRTRRLVFVLVLLVAAAIAYWLLQPAREAPAIAEIGQVQSSVSQEGNSLRVIVQWQLHAPPAARGGDSLRVEVRIDSLDTAVVRMHESSRRQDTTYMPVPAPGSNVDGLSCVTVQHPARLARETCTIWRYVRPLAQPSLRRGAAGGDTPARIVVRPQGLQVDHDVGGRCAAWQRRNPGASVWIEINRIAVPPCTGPNNRPTVAQFCAFAELGDGRRVKTANSANNPYCDTLFIAWERERAS